MSQLQQALAAGRFVVTSELTPPKGIDLKPLFAKADKFKGLVDAVNVTDCHKASVAMAPIAVAHLLLDRGIEPILQMTGRDRNRIGLQADMLAAAALGIENLVFMGGDPPSVGDHPDAKPVFDLLSGGLLQVARDLQQGSDMSGKALHGAPSFCVGAVVNPGATDLDGEIGRMAEKIEAGATFLQSQAVYDADAYEVFAQRARDYDINIIAGIIPLKSVKMARYLNDNVPGIEVPDSIMQELADSSDIEATAIDIAARTIRQLKPLSQGVHLMAIGWEDHIPAIFQRAEIA